ncbi:MAG: HD domain-containing protein [Clostridiales bacterium]|nr:HD domain-containing protein [Clostridiales bacterium]MDD7035072.1 HD domain-containing protein [Bacillota bacterium]MDY2920397.1 HD domain-containing protein [Lentihominibacter sp.]
MNVSILQRLETAGFSAYIVGGRLRNMLLGLEEDPENPWDTDVTTNALPEQVKDVFSDCRVLETGIRHGTVTVLTPEPVEITTFRKDGAYSDSRHPDSVDFSATLEEDLARRDFTVNAIAMDARGNIEDPFGGREDLNNHILRTVGDPEERFREDPLRIFRALRFMAALTTPDGERALYADSKTEAALFTCAPLLEKIAPERLCSEFYKLITGDFAGDVIREYVDIIGVVIPPLLAMKDFNQHNPYHKYTVLEHCIRAMEAVDKDRVMKLAALFHDVGKPETFFIGDDGIGHMYGHPQAGERIFRSIMTRLKADRATTDQAAALIKHHDLVFHRDRALLKRWMNRFTPELLLRILTLKEADNLATGNMSPELGDKFREIRSMILEILSEGECFSLKDLAIDGNDVIAAGIEAGPAVGEVLSRLLSLVTEGRIENTREALLSAISRS